MFSTVAGIGTNASTAKTSGYGIGGLVSGIDTSTLIKSLTTAAQSKIDAAMQKKQKIEWKQESYNSIIDKLTAFKDDYFDVVGKYKLSSSSAFNTWKVASSSDAISATSTGANTGARLVISAVDEIASASTIQSGSAVTGEITAAASLEAFKGKTLKLTLDGVTKTVSFGDDPQQALTDAFGLSSTHGVSGPRVKLVQEGATVIFTTTGSSKLSVAGDTSTLSALGLKAGASNRIDMFQSISSVSFVKELAGDAYEFSINGVDFSFDGSSSVISVINTINSSEAGVRVTYNEVDDTFTMMAKTTGTSENITLEQTKGNLLSAMFGASAAGVREIGGKAQYIPELMSSKTKEEMAQVNWSALAGKSFDLTIDGVTKTIALPAIDAALDPALQLATAVTNLTAQTRAAFGLSDVSFQSEDGSIKLVTGGKAVAFNTVDEAGEETALLSALGFAPGTSNNATKEMSLASLGITEEGTISLGAGETVTYTKETTLGELINAINEKTEQTGITTTFADGRLALATEHENFEFSDSGSALRQLTGTAAFSSGDESTAKKTDGTNAVIRLEDGTVIERNTNSFAVKGVLLQINRRTSETTTVSSTQDMDSVVESMKKFAEEYNSLALGIKSLIVEETFSKYPPLTDAQREDMSESQIKLWEEKARSGVLKNDPTLNALLMDMEDMINSISENTGYSLEKLGFEFSTDMKTGTKISLNEETFRKVIADDHEAVSDFFTQTTVGFSDRFATLVDSYAKSSSIEPGKLVQVAGSSIYKEGEYTQQLEELEERIADLKNKLTAQETRLWKQFSAMETALSQLSAQSSWLTNFSAS